MSEARITPAGLQVERALALGYQTAAYNLYHWNMRDQVAMVEGDDPGGQGSVWPEWHRRIQSAIGDGPMVGDELIDELGIEGAAEVLGLGEPDPEAVATVIADQLGLALPATEDDRTGWLRAHIYETLSEFAPSVIERRIRNDAGEVVDVETIPNLDSSGRTARSRSETNGPPALRPVAPVRPARPRQRLWVAAPAAIAAAFIVFGVLPEALGDWPYNAWGKDTRHITSHSHAPSPPHAIGTRHDVS